MGLRHPAECASHMNVEGLGCSSARQHARRQMGGLEAGAGGGGGGGLQPTQACKRG